MNTQILYIYIIEREWCPALQQHQILGRSNSGNKALGQPPGRPPDMGEDHDVTPASHYGGDADSCACCHAQPCDTLIQLHTNTGKITPLPSGWLHFGKSQASLPLADLSAQGNDNNETIRWTQAGVLIMGTRCWDSSAIHRGSIPGNTFSSGWKDGEGIAFRHTASKLTSQQNKWEDLYQNFHHECFLKRSFLT